MPPLATDIGDTARFELCTLLFSSDPLRWISRSLLLQPCSVIRLSVNQGKSWKIWRRNVVLIFLGMISKLTSSWRTLRMAARAMEELSCSMKYESHTATSVLYLTSSRISWHALDGTETGMNSISSFTKSIGVGGCTSQDKVDKIFVSMARMSFGENEFLLNSARKLNLNFFFSVTFAAMFRVVRETRRAVFASHLLPLVATYRSKRSILIATVSLERWKWSTTL